MYGIKGFKSHHMPLTRLFYFCCDHNVFQMWALLWSKSQNEEDTWNQVSLLWPAHTENRCSRLWRKHELVLLMRCLLWPSGQTVAHIHTAAFSTLSPVLIPPAFPHLTSILLFHPDVFDSSFSFQCLTQIEVFGGCLPPSPLVRPIDGIPNRHHRIHQHPLNLSPQTDFREMHRSLFSIASNYGLAGKRP